MTKSKEVLLMKSLLNGWNSVGTFTAPGTIRQEGLLLGRFIVQCLLLSKRALRDVRAAGKVCVLDVDMQVGTASPPSSL